MQQLPEDYLPEWGKLVVATVLGAGGLHWFRAWLENRRLAKRDFRELLLDRIRELEKTVAHMQVRMGNLRVEMAHIEAENAQLRRKLGLSVRGHEAQDADQQLDRGDDGGEPTQP
jgi:hypothetical protein